MSKEVNGEVRQFRYDGENLILEMDDNNSVTASYTFGQDIDDPLMMQRNGKGYYYVKDGLGSVTALTDSTGNVKHEYKYGVFGKIVNEAGDTIENQFTYTSRELDKETGNYFYRARYYNAGMGRFLSEDPLGIVGDVNIYRYVRNRPIVLRDPFGLKPGDSYSNQDDAGKDAIRDVDQKSVDQSKETGGYVYRNPDGSYSYTAPTTGSSDGITLPPPPPTTTADYHTHGSDDPGYNNNDFSQTDKDGNINGGINGYLGTPEGGIKKFDINLNIDKTIDVMPIYTRPPADACRVRR